MTMRRLPGPGRRLERGVGLLEAMVSMSVLGIAIVGITQMQVVAVGSNHFSRKMTQASSLGRDLLENMSLWAYDDLRLAAGGTVTSLDDEAIAQRADLPRTAPITDNKPHFAEGATTNAVTAEALVLGGAAYDGLAADVDGDGQADFERYWSVFLADLNSDGVEEGKYVVVVVRWREAGLGFRQVSFSTFRANERNFAL